MAFVGDPGRGVVVPSNALRPGVTFLILAPRDFPMHCSADRIKASASYYSDANGPEALRTFLISVAGVSRVEDVPQSERLRVNYALRRVDEAAPPQPSTLQGIACKAFARMAVRK
uniref:Uncharacterized protein n=1 Tax=Bradyrhizobium barranii subsp. barranii TaxID=2823807 RepID=A0A7Z0QNZ4_9BRAD